VIRYSLMMTAALLCSLVGALPQAQAQTTARKPQVPELKIEKYTLANGLEVILHEDKTTPVVDVDVW